MSKNFILRNKQTGLFYNGTNFSTELCFSAALVFAASKEEAERNAQLVWEGEIEAIPAAEKAFDWKRSFQSEPTPPEWAKPTFDVTKAPLP